MSHDHGDLWTRAKAVSTVRSLRSDAVSTQSVRSVSVTEAFEGATVAEDVLASSDVPAHSHSTMDGFAFDASADYPFSLVEGEVFPEDEPPSIDAGQAIRVATGAPIPEQANAVLKVEEATVTDGHLEGAAIEPGTYVYERGSNVAAGEVLVEAGEVLSPKDALLLRDLGRESISVRDPFDVGLLATGTELHEGRSTDLDSPMLASLIRSWGHEATIEGTVPDEYDRVEDAIASIANDRDVVLTTGGTSVGKKDHVIRALRALGDVHFHRVNIRPGKPIAAATLPEQDATVFAIPGKPVGAHTIATLVMRPFFTGGDRLASVDLVASSSVDLPDPAFEYAIPVTIDGQDAIPLGQAGSKLSVYEETFDPSVLSSTTRVTRADGFVLTESGIAAGETVSVIPYPVVE